ncbi:MAG: hypothetical protein M3445_09260, partial [Actinomycetota bacterium]|nr:hypothetical protein [Actinomycetota bacterium]
MSQATPERPHQATLAGWLIMGGSILVVLLAFQRMAELTSLESQRAVEEFLARPPGDGMGLSVNDLTSIIRALCLVSGACAAATAILGFYVLQRAKSARIALSIIAPVLLVSGMATSGFTSSLVGAATVMLWFQPTRDWFDGIERPRERPAPVQPPPGQPLPMTGFGAPPAPRSTPAPARPSEARPGTLVWACVLTWIFCGLGIVGMGLSALVLLAAPDLFFDELTRQNPELVEQGVTQGGIETAAYAGTAVVIPWCAAAIVFAVLAFRGIGWARTAL